MSDEPAVETEGSRPRGPRLRWPPSNVLALLGLNAVAVAQPLLDQLGPNPEFFVASDASAFEIVLLALLAVFAIPIAISLIELVAYAIGERVGMAVHLTAVAALAGLFGMTLAGDLDITGAVPAVAAGVLLGVAVAALTGRFPAIGLGLRYLSLAALLVLVSFLGLSDSAELVRGAEAEAVTGVTIENPAPVIVLVMDAAPLNVLLDERTGEINAERFPNFARLAERGTWFRNATAAANQTNHSVPAFLSGVVPDDINQAPTSDDYQRTLFTLLGEDYDVRAQEVVTALCPTSVCRTFSGESTAPSTFDADRFRSSVRDAAVVLGHRSLPPSLRSHLPSISGQWAGFANEGTAGDPAAGASPEDSIPVTAEELRQAREERVEANQAVVTPEGQAAQIQTMIDSIEAGGDPGFWYNHVLLPHHPWGLTAEGYAYPSPPSRPGFAQPGEDGTTQQRWSDDPFFADQALQRVTLQFGAVDRLLGELMDHLDQQGMWDDTLLAVVADHGEAFRPGVNTRNIDGGADVDDIIRVPFFLKLPDQEAGETRDDPTSLVDFVPTVVDALGIETDWEFDGQSLLEEVPEDRPPPTVAWASWEAPTTLAGLIDAATYTQERFNGRRDWLGVSSIGELGRLVGRPVSELAVVPDDDLVWGAPQLDGLRHVDRRTGALQVIMHGDLVLPEGREAPEEVLVAVNGVVAGVGGGFTGEGRERQFWSVVAEELLPDGENEVELLIPGAVGTFSRARLADQ